MRTVEKIHLSAPDVSSLEIERVVAAMESGWVAPLGPQVDGFEADLAQRCGRAHAVALSSGTAALHLSLLQAGARPGTCVITSTLTFVATANAIRYTGAVPIFLDTLPDGTMDPTLLDETLSELRSSTMKVAAVLPVDLLGRCADYTVLQDICNRYAVPMIADAAESLGAFHADRPAGSFGDMAVLSFNGNKVITTSGGGALLTNDAAIASRARYLGSQARHDAPYYLHSEVGYNYRLSNILAALGRGQLERLDDMLKQRRQLRDMYRNIAANLPGVSVFQGDNDTDDNCWLTAWLVDPTVSAWEPMDLMAFCGERGIETRPLWKPMHQQPAYSAYRRVLTGCSDQLFTQGVTLPSGSGMDGSQVQRVYETLHEFGAQHG